jgi:hypothetical protein
MNFMIEERDNGMKWARPANWETTKRMSTFGEWCRQTGCGKQVSINAISFKDDAELTAFLLRWQA